MLFFPNANGPACAARPSTQTHERHVRERERGATETRPPPGPRPGGGGRAPPQTPAPAPRPAPPTPTALPAQLSRLTHPRSLSPSRRPPLYVVTVHGLPSVNGPVRVAQRSTHAHKRHARKRERGANERPPPPSLSCPHQNGPACAAFAPHTLQWSQPIIATPATLRCHRSRFRVSY